MKIFVLEDNVIIKKLIRELVDEMKLTVSFISSARMPVEGIKEIMMSKVIEFGIVNKEMVIGVTDIPDLEKKLPCMAGGRSLILSKSTSVHVKLGLIIYDQAMISSDPVSQKRVKTLMRVELEKAINILAQTKKTGQYDPLDLSKIDTHTRNLFEQIVKEADKKTYTDRDNATKIDSLDYDGLDTILKKSTMAASTKKVVVIGSSIGGIERLEEIIGLLNKAKSYPPIFINQHILKNFVNGLQQRLSKVSGKLVVKVGEDGEKVVENTIYIAPGDSHMVLEGRAGGLFIQIPKNQRVVSKHIPSIDVLFRSVTNSVGRNALGIILTGMGKDGVIGVGELQKAGAPIFAQEKSTCVIQGIAGECIKRGYIKTELSIKQIAEAIEKW